MKTYIDRNKVRIFLITFICAVIAGSQFALAADVKNTDYQEAIAQKVLRFHVRADNDTKEAQQLKLKVRDTVASYLQKELESADSKAEALKIVKEHLSDIESVAQEEITKNQAGYSVSAQIDNEYFPQKEYGIYTFPSGDYDALVVSIGEAKGHNWWCVMYPNLCFLDGIYEEPEVESEQLKEVLDEDEYHSLLNSDQKLTFRFKYLTFFNQFLE